MKRIHIITPVKDSIELTLQTIDAIMASNLRTPFTYTVYNDFSTEENTSRLREASGRLGFELVNLAEITDHPSPNYLLVLQMAQERAVAEEAGLAIVESDVIVKSDTLQSLFDGASEEKIAVLLLLSLWMKMEISTIPICLPKGAKIQFFPNRNTVAFAVRF